MVIRTKFNPVFSVTSIIARKIFSFPPHGLLSVDISFI
jgi:hypothetical protein